MPSTLSRVTRRGANQRRRGARAVARAGRRRAPERLRDLHRHHALVAQAIDDLGFVGGVELAARHLAGGADGAVA